MNETIALVCSITSAIFAVVAFAVSLVSIMQTSKQWKKSSYAPIIESLTKPLLKASYATQKHGDMALYPSSMFVEDFYHALTLTQAHLVAIGKEKEAECFDISKDDSWAHGLISLSKDYEALEKLPKNDPSYQPTATRFQDTIEEKIGALLTILR